MGEDFVSGTQLLVLALPDVKAAWLLSESSEDFPEPGFASYAAYRRELCWDLHRSCLSLVLIRSIYDTFH